jgi:hypothetical protein
MTDRRDTMTTTRTACSARIFTLGLIAAAGLGSAAHAQLRVANWNITNYSSGRINEFQTAIYGVVPALNENATPGPMAMAGQRFAPDILIVQEIIGSSLAAGTTSLTNFRNLLNTAAGSPGDWAFATFATGPDSKGGLFYRTSKLALAVDTTVISIGGLAPEPPRNTERWIVRLAGYADLPATRIAVYGTHLKSGSAGSDISRRQLEATRIRTDIQTLVAASPGLNFLVGGDFNILSSSDASYQVFTGAASGIAQLFDPIITPGSWNGSTTFRNIFTQDPALVANLASAQMDSRFDFVLLSGSLRDGQGMDYIGSLTTPWNLNTFADPNHSYRCWGNDGGAVNAPMIINNNLAVGTTIANALGASANSGGHLPVFLDLRVPAKALISSTNINFGSVPQGSVQTRTFTISNSGDVALWTAAGIASLTYTMPSGGGAYTVSPSGAQTDAAGGGVNTHTVTLDTSTPGLTSRTITITTSAPENPSFLVTFTSNVEAANPCPNPSNIAGLNQSPIPDGQLTADDIIVYLSRFFAGASSADVAGPNQSTVLDGQLTADDIIVFLSRYFAGC